MSEFECQICPSGKGIYRGDETSLRFGCLGMRLDISLGYIGEEVLRVDDDECV